MNAFIKIGGIIAAAMILFIVLGAFWTHYVPTTMDATAQLLPPSPAHIFGTDNLGRDIFSRVLEGTGTTLTIALLTVALGAFFGILIGAFTGYYGGVWDNILMRFCDAITAFPSFMLALVIVSVLGTGKYHIILALGFLFIPRFARIVRGDFARAAGRDYVENAKLMGAGALRIMFVHILPNTRGVLLSAIAIGFNNAVLAEAGMSYLGIGVQPPDPSLGRMLSEAQTYLLSAPWFAVSAGAVIILLILGFSLLGEGLTNR
jgi:peptide/nickel transport system permease protein